MRGRRHFRVSVNGNALFRTELLNDWICDAAAVNVGNNIVVNVWGDKGGCTAKRANTGVQEERAVTVAATSWALAAGVASSAILNVTQGDAETGPGKIELRH